MKKTLRKTYKIEGHIPYKTEAWVRTRNGNHMGYNVRVNGERFYYYVLTPEEAIELGVNKYIENHKVSKHEQIRNQIMENKNSYVYYKPHWTQTRNGKKEILSINRAIEQYPTEHLKAHNRVIQALLRKSNTNIDVYINNDIKKRSILGTFVLPIAGNRRYRSYNRHTENPFIILYLDRVTNYCIKNRKGIVATMKMVLMHELVHASDFMQRRKLGHSKRLPSAIQKQNEGVLLKELNIGGH